ncbi:MAG: SUMF1/EgtB/PvdO family nonheme iron enzyme, partial [Desulfobulbaceae bacterium]|nr:SUMF1/EgtB/PvdO family nonheme iron enzyme [Desulfobulbaceae bacterium]
WGDNLIVLTSRPFGYQDLADSEQIATAHIDAFGKKEIEEFLVRWGKGLYPDDDERERSKYLPELHSAIIDSTPIRKLARNPVMLTCLCVVHWNERRLPEGKPDLLAAVLKWLLNAREEIRKEKGYTSEFAEECFKALAMAMTDHADGKQVIVDLAWAADQLTKPFDDILAVRGEERVQREGRRFLEEEMLYSGIVEKYGTGRLRFWHLNFQEHYAAKALIDRSDDKWWKIVKPHLGEPQWFEVLDHLAGCLAWTGRYRLDLLVKNVLGTAKTSDLASLARVVGILGRLLRILNAYKYQPPARLGWDKARDMVMEIFTLKGASRVPVQERIAAAEALGMGDPRIKPIDPEMLPVPGMEDVSLGKYPVTVAEYQRFVNNNGYGDSEYWDKKWWSRKEKQEWTEPGNWDEQTEHQNWPVTEVSWYEASAYCKWLTEQTKRPYRLPKEEEWEKAATNPNGEYPWGNDDPNSELLNFDKNVGSPTPVGIYPAGAAVGGHLDMAGNVWEWNWNLYKEEGSVRVIRGGSWNIDALCCCFAICFFNPPSLRGLDVGFRLSR